MTPEERIQTAKELIALPPELMDKVMVALARRDAQVEPLKQEIIRLRRCIVDIATTDARYTSVAALRFRAEREISTWDKED